MSYGHNFMNGSHGYKQNGYPQNVYPQNNYPPGYHNYPGYNYMQNYPPNPNWQAHSQPYFAPQYMPQPHFNHYPPQHYPYPPRTKIEESCYKGLMNCFMKNQQHGYNNQYGY